MNKAFARKTQQALKRTKVRRVDVKLECKLYKITVESMAIESACCRNQKCWALIADPLRPKGSCLFSADRRPHKTKFQQHQLQTSPLLWRVANFMPLGLALGSWAIPFDQVHQSTLSTGRKKNLLPKFDEMSAVLNSGRVGCVFILTRAPTLVRICVSAQNGGRLNAKTITQNTIRRQQLEVLFNKVSRWIRSWRGPRDTQWAR